MRPSVEGVGNKPLLVGGTLIGKSLPFKTPTTPKKRPLHRACLRDLTSNTLALPRSALSPPVPASGRSAFSEMN